MRTVLKPEYSVQISDGMTQTSADGAALVFDSKYGIMFCAYMPGMQGNYGESRGRICLTYFPASQPTNSRTVTVASGHCEYTDTAIGLGDGRVRVFYERDSKSDGDHRYCFKDFDYLSGELSEEQIVFVKQPDGSKVPLTGSVQFAYLEEHGFGNHTFLKTEQAMFAGCSFFRDDDGSICGSITSFLAEPILFRSYDSLQTLEFWGIFPYTAQYEMDYKRLNGVLYAVFRTDTEIPSIACARSFDNGKTWTEPVRIENSIQCRPRLLVYAGHILTVCNYFNPDTQNRPAIQQGRTSIRMLYGEADDPNKNAVLADFYSKYGIVNVSVIDIMNDLYMAYSTSVTALEYHNGNPMVRGKDAVRYINLGDLTLE